MSFFNFKYIYFEKMILFYFYIFKISPEFIFYIYIFFHFFKFIVLPINP